MVEVTWSDLNNGKDPVTVLYHAVLHPNKMMIQLKPFRYQLKSKKDDKMFGHLVIEKMKVKENTLMIRFENVNELQQI